MDQTIEEAAKRQSGLEAAKAAFFASGGQSRWIPVGMGKDSPDAERLPKPVYGYRTIEAPKKKRGRFISEEERLALAVQLMECKANGMSRYKAAKHVCISETLCRAMITNHSLDLPAST